MFSQRPLPKTHSTTKVEKSKLQEVGGVGEVSAASTHGHHRRQWFQYLQHGHCHILRRTPARQRQLESTACMVSREFEHAPAALGESGVPWVSPKKDCFTNPGLGAELSRHGDAREIAIMPWKVQGHLLVVKMYHSFKLHLEACETAPEDAVAFLVDKKGEFYLA